MGPLIGFADRALRQLGDLGLFGGDVPVFALDVVGRVGVPNPENMIDRLDEHGGAVVVQIAERFRVRQQPARADSE